MRKIIFLLTFTSIVLGTMAQNGRYSVTNSDSYTNSKLQDFLMSMLRSGSATITVENNENPSMMSEEVDTNEIVEIVKDVTFDIADDKDISFMLGGIPSRVDIDDQRILVTGTQNDTVRLLPIVQKTCKKKVWTFQCEDKADVELVQKSDDTYLLRIPGMTALKLKKD